MVGVAVRRRVGIVDFMVLCVGFEASLVLE